ncbi:metallophosphoesterase family protein [Thalassospira lucentensis]|uniref:metallophosphoesterase family protein n=1 Tax=Thalassospira lucentensis TaxID=168935 RepID=UPI00399D5BA0
MLWVIKILFVGYFAGYSSNEIAVSGREGALVKVAVLSDIHANIYALEAVIDLIDKEKISHVLVAGDLVGYYYWPKEVVEVCRTDSRFTCIQGNHESNLKIARKDASVLDRLTKKYGSSYQICLDVLTEEQLDWLLNLPDRENVVIGDATFSLLHEASVGGGGYLYPDSALTEIVANYSDAQYSVLGHTHYPFVHSRGNRWLINPGSVGQPRDIGNLASFLIVDLASNVVVPKRVPFPTKKIIQCADEYDPHLPYLKNILQRGLL